MKDLFRPSSTVVIGVSARWFNLGKEIARNLLEFNYDGVIRLVGTEPGVIFGHRIHTSLEEIEEPIDLAIILTPAATIPGLMEQCGRKGIKRVIIESGGFGEFSGEEDRLSDQIVAIAKKYGIRFIGPNCIGIVNWTNGLATPFMPMKNVFRKGSVGIIAQSGGVALSLLYMFDSEQIGLSKFAAIGNKLNIDENDLIEHYLEDPDTSVICLYLESIEDGRRLCEIGRRSPKPIVVHKANIGSLSRVIASSHTAALANDDQVVDAALRQAGIVRFKDMQSYLDFVKILQLPRMKGRNLAIVSRSGGHAVIAADAAATYGFSLPPFPQQFLDEIRKHLRADVIRLTNPLDLGDLFDFQVYIRIVEHTLQEDNIDGVLFLHTYSAASPEKAASRRLLQSVAGLPAKYGKPVAMCISCEQMEMSTLHKEFEFPIFLSPERAVEAFDRAIAFHARRSSIRPAEEIVRPAQAPDDETIRSLIYRAMAEGRSPLLHEALEMIRAAGIRVPEFIPVLEPEIPESELRRFPGPYAVKIIASGVSHKSDEGGVILGLQDDEAVRSAAMDMWAGFGKAPDAGMIGVVVQKMATRRPGSYELIIGGKRDPQFGPVVMVGYGGIFVEFFGKIALRMAPLSRDEIDGMIDELPGAEILKGVRGRPAVDRNALIEAILGVAYLMVNFPEIREIDVNPIICSPSGAMAVDARVVLGKGGSGH